MATCSTHRAGTLWRRSAIICLFIVGIWNGVSGVLVSNFYYIIVAAKFILIHNMLTLGHFAVVRKKLCNNYTHESICCALQSIRIAFMIDSFTIA